jgi:protein TonB
VKLRNFIFISILLHAGAVWLFRPQALNVQDFTEIQVMETVSSPHVNSLTSAHATKSLAKPQVHREKILPSSDSQSDEKKTATPLIESGGGGNKEQGVHEGVVSEAPKVIQEKKILYPISARRAGVEGVVELKLVIDTEGRVREAAIIRGPGYGLDEAALEGIKEFVFSPAKVGNEKVAVRILYKYRFRLGGNG